MLLTSGHSTQSKGWFDAFAVVVMRRGPSYGVVKVKKYLISWEKLQIEISWGSALFSNKWKLKVLLLVSLQIYGNANIIYIYFVIAIYASD